MGSKLSDVNSNELTSLLLVMGILVLAEGVSFLLRYLVSRPAARGVGFFLVSSTAFLVLRKRSRPNLFLGLLLCLAIGLIGLISELGWPSR